MRHFITGIATLAVVLLCSGAAIAGPVESAAETSPAPEELLHAGTLAYVNFRGFESSAGDFQQTVLADLCREELAGLIEHFRSLLISTAQSELLNERNLMSLSPDRLIRFQAATREIPNLAATLNGHGFVAGLEVVAAQEQRFQVTLVFFEAGRNGDRSAILAGLAMIAMAAETDLIESETDGRKVVSLNVPPPVQVHCWQEGPHMVIVLGTESPQRTIDLAAGKLPNLTGSEAFRNASATAGYPEYLHLFVDTQRIASVVTEVMPPAALMIEQLGLAGLQGVSLHVGFEGRSQRSTLVVFAPGRRRGLLQLLSADDSIDMEELPPLPPDVAFATATNVDWNRAYEAAISAIETIIQISDPEELPEFRGGLRTLEASLGIDLHGDLFDTLDSTAVFYNSPSEGPLSLGMGAMIRVRDPQKLQETLRKLVGAIGQASGEPVQLRQREYHGVTLNMVEVGGDEFPLLPTWVIHRGWLVAGMFPQTVQGYVYRARPDRRVWKTPPELEAMLRSHQQRDPRADLTGISVNDPVATVRQLASIAPLITRIVVMNSGDKGDSDRFDLSLIPPTQALTEPLTPNVTLTLDNGQTIRYESYASLPLPVQITGLEAYLYTIVVSFAGFIF